MCERVSYQKEIPVIGSYDIVMLGGGPAGTCAAIEAARNGAKTLLVESTGMLVAGKTISCMSQAAGAASAIALSDHHALCDVPTAQLQSLLRAHGASLD